MENSSLERFESLAKNSWDAIYIQGGALGLPKNSSSRVCSASHLLILSDAPLWVYAEDFGGYKEVELSLNVSVDEKFGQKEHEVLFRPSRMEVKDFPSYCRMDLFLNEKLSVARIIEGGKDEQFLTGLVLENGRGDSLGIFVDEDIPINLILTTDNKSIHKLCEKSGTVSKIPGSDTILKIKHDLD